MLIAKYKASLEGLTERERILYRRCAHATTKQLLSLLQITSDEPVDFPVELVTVSPDFTPSESDDEESEFEADDEAESDEDEKPAKPVKEEYPVTMKPYMGFWSQFLTTEQGQLELAELYRLTKPKKRAVT